MIDIALIKVGDIVVRIIHPNDPNDYLCHSGLIVKIIPHIAAKRLSQEITVTILDDSGVVRRWLLYDDSPYRIISR